MESVYTFRRRHRLSHNREYQAAYAARLKKSAGPLTVFGRPNGRAEHRLGLAVGRQVGPACRRHRVKRMIREAFRLHRQTLPHAAPTEGGYDLVVRVRPHPASALGSYERWLVDAATRIDREHQKRLAKDGGKGT